MPSGTIGLRCLRLAERQEECRSVPRARLDPDFPPVAGNDFPADSEAHARAGVIAPVETFENTENLLKEFRLDSDSVILDGNEPSGTPRFS